MLGTLAPIKWQSIRRWCSTYSVTCYETIKSRCVAWFYVSSSSI